MRASRRLTAGRKRVPMASPAARRSSTSRSAPGAITTAIPEAVASFAASILVRIPPVPCAVPASPPRASMQALMRATSGIRRASGVVPGVAGVQPPGVGQVHQEVGVHQVGHHRRQVVVVPEEALVLGRALGRVPLSRGAPASADVDLVHGHHVVLVDHREHAVLHQPDQGGAGVQVALPVAQVGPGEEGLGHGQAVRAQQAVPRLHQQVLPHGGQHLLAGDVPSRAPQSQAGPARRDGPGGDEEHLGAPAGEGRHLAGEVAHAGHVQVGAVPGEDGRPHLDHQPPQPVHPPRIIERCSRVWGPGRWG